MFVFTPHAMCVLTHLQRFRRHNCFFVEPSFVPARSESAGVNRELRFDRLQGLGTESNQVFQNRRELGILEKLPDLRSGYESIRVALLVRFREIAGEPPRTQTTVNLERHRENHVANVVRFPAAQVVGTFAVRQIAAQVIQQDLHAVFFVA